MSQQDIPTLRPFSARVPGGAVALRAHHWAAVGRRSDSIVGDRRVNGEPERYITCEMHLAGKEAPQLRAPLASHVTNTYWRVTISREEQHEKPHKTVLSKAYRATVELHLGGSPDHRVGPITLLRGRCRDWKDAVVEVGECSPWGEALQELGRRLYGEAARDQWSMVRPFTYRWAWHDAEEPNARYSEVTLPGDWEFAAELDGAVASVFSQDAETAREIASVHNCNAFILFADSGPRVYHRNGMRAWDKVDMDDWRARVIASAGEK